MENKCGFFRDDATGCPSYGRLASAFCCVSALVCALAGKDYVGTFLASGASFYLISKGQQAVTNIWGK